MATRRRTNKTPPHKVMVRMFPTVPKYFDWIMHSAAKVSRKEREARQHNDSVLCAVLGSMLVKACRENGRVEKYFHIGEITPMKNAVRELLVKESLDEYSLRFYLRHLGPQRTYQMQTGYPHNTAKDSALLRLNQSLTIEERHTVRKMLSPCLDGNYLSPAKMTAWLVPVLIRAIKKVNRKIICGHSIRTFPLHSKEGLAVVIVYTSKSSQMTFSSKVTFDLGVQIQELPKYYKIQHPYPKHLQACTTKGRELVREIKEGFENGEHMICLKYPLSKRTTSESVALPVLGHGLGMTQRSKTVISGFSVADPDLEYGLKSSSLHAFHEVKKTSDEPANLWKIDYTHLEKHIASAVKYQPSYRCIQEAFKLYRVLSTCGTKVLPVLNEDSKRSLGLWLYKQSDESFHDMMTAFMALLELSGACLEKGFCPSFCQPRVNTMAGILREKEHEEEEGSDVMSEGSGSEVTDVDSKEDNNLLKLFTIIDKDDVTAALELLKIC